MSNSYNAGQSNEPRSENDGDSASRKIREAFAALPFDQKISTLIRVELDMLGDAINTVMSAASKAADDIANAITREESKSEPGTSANL